MDVARLDPPVIGGARGEPRDGCRHRHRSVAGARGRGAGHAGSVAGAGAVFELAFGDFAAVGVDAPVQRRAGLRDFGRGAGEHGRDFFAGTFFDRAVGVAVGLAAFFLGAAVGVQQVEPFRFLLQPPFRVALFTVDLRRFGGGQFFQRAGHVFPVVRFVGVVAPRLVFGGAGTFVVEELVLVEFFRAGSVGFLEGGVGEPVLFALHDFDGGLEFEFGPPVVDDLALRHFPRRPQQGPGIFRRDFEFVLFEPGRSPGFLGPVFFFAPVFDFRVVVSAVGEDPHFRSRGFTGRQRREDRFDGPGVFGDERPADELRLRDFIGAERVV